MLSGGEDYELIFSFKKKKALDFIQKYDKDFLFSKIGSFFKGSGVRVLDKRKRSIKFKKIGYSHF